MTLGELAGDGGLNLMLIKIGHGVGAGVVVDGHLLLGDRFAAGEIGHVVVDDRGEPCACGRTGFLETVVAAPLLRDRRDLQRGLAVAGRRLGEALAPVVSTLNLHDVVLSGPLDVLDGTFRDAAVATIRNRTMPAVGDERRPRFHLGETMSSSAPPCSCSSAGSASPGERREDPTMINKRLVAIGLAGSWPSPPVAPTTKAPTTPPATAAPRRRRRCDSWLNGGVPTRWSPRSRSSSRPTTPASTCGSSVSSGTASSSD